MTENLEPPLEMEGAPEAPEWLQMALAEDLGSRGDLTSAMCLAGEDVSAKALVKTREAGRLSGVGFACQIFYLVDPELKISVAKQDGNAMQAGDVILEIAGSAASLLAAERTALNVVQQLSGVATTTSLCVDAVAGTGVKIFDTRKTVPGWRAAQKAAVVHGGGHNHRLGLYDQILLKENHFSAARDKTAREMAERVLAQAPDGVQVIVEASTLEEAVSFADAGVDVILLDNFSDDELCEVVAVLNDHSRRGRFELEASGGVTLDSVRATAETGVDRISIGMLTHSAPAVDLSMSLESCDT